jgi:hypothetical protein
MPPSSFRLPAARLSPFSIKLLGACWITQLGLASLLSQLAPIPVRPLLVDRSFCSEQQGQYLVKRYHDLLISHQLAQQRLSPVIEVNVFGVKVNSDPPSLAQFSRLASVGEGDGQQMASLRRQYPKALVLSCNQP